MGLLGEPGAGSSCIDEFAVAIIAQDECAHAVNSIGRKGKAADDEFLLLVALQLEPVAAAARTVLALAEFGDDAFGAQLAGVREDFAGVAGEVVAHPYG